jgi:hypothetical protein
MNVSTHVGRAADRRPLHLVAVVTLVIVAFLLFFALAGPAQAAPMTVPYLTNYGNWGDQGATGTMIINNVNTWGVAFGPSQPTSFTTSRWYTITSITNWHSDTPFLGGTISLLDGNGATLGSWPADWVTYRFWKYARPNINIGPGTYTIVDSSHSTWAYNTTSLYMGFTRVLAIPLGGPPAITSDGGGPTADVYVPAGSTVITDVNADDPNPADVLKYRIKSFTGPMLKMVWIDPATGVLSFPPFLAGWMAYWRLQSSYYLGKVTVEVRDSEIPPLSDTQVLTIWLVPNK